MELEKTKEFFNCEFSSKKEFFEILDSKNLLENEILYITIFNIKDNDFSHVIKINNNKSDLNKILKKLKVVLILKSVEKRFTNEDILFRFNLTNNQNLFNGKFN